MMVRQAHQQQCDDLNSVTEHSRSMPNGDAMSLPNGWETKEIGDVLSLEYGKPLPKEKRTPNGLYPVYGANGIKDRTNEFYVEEPSIIVGRKGSAGEINYTEDKFWPLDVTYFTKFDKSELNLDFLFHLLTLLELPKLAKGVKPGINRNDVYAIKTKIPPLDEQKRIVAKLDECFEAIHIARTNVEKNLSNAKELFQSQLNQIFASTGSATDGDSPELAEGWVEKKLVEVCENLDSRRIPITKNKRISGDIPYYGASGIVDYVADFIFDEDLLLVSEDGANLLARTYPIAFPISGKTWVNNHAHALKFENMGSQKFVEYYLNSIKLDDYVSGMAQPKLNQKMLNSIPVPYPEIDIQKEIVNQLDDLKSKTQTLESNYQQELDALDELKKSILQKAFSGELTIENEEKCD